jgi:hypothetical protein
VTRIAVRVQRAGLNVLITLVVVLLERRMRKAVDRRR